jgi:hypothetical protein
MTDLEFDQLMDAVAREWELPRLNETAGIDQRWLESFLALRIADLVAQVAIGDRLKNLAPHDRAWFRHQAESLIQDAIARIDVMLLAGKAADEAAGDAAAIQQWRSRDEAI